MAKIKDVFNLKRIDIEYFEGVNNNVSSHLAKRTELKYSENARCKKIGVIEKRDGHRQLGSDTPVATANLSLFNFPNTTGTSIYRISTVSATTTAYYLDNNAVWTALTGNGTSLTAAQFDTANAEGNCFLVNGTDANRYIGPNGTYVYTSADLGSSTTQFDITNPSGSTYTYTYDTTGTDPLITTNVNVGDIIHITAQNFAAGNKGSFTVTAVGANYFSVTNASGAVESNKTIGTGVVRVSNHLTNSPTATKIKFYKDKLYLGDYKIGTTEYKTGVAFSSTPLGIVAKVDGDHVAGSTTINVTDTSFIYSDDVLDVYRGGTLIETLIVTAKTESTITVSTTTNALSSSDDLWVAGTYTGKRIFRWANRDSGDNVKTFDTFKISGDPDNAITMMEDAGDVLMIANNNGLSSWNETSVTNYGFGIGCASKNGYVKNMGVLFFIHYGGVYTTTGGIPQLISTPVEEYFEGATKAGIEASAAGKKGKSVFFYIGDVTLYNEDGSTKKTLTDVVLEFDIRKQNWHVHTGIKVTQFATYISSSDADRLQFTKPSGNYLVFEFLVKPSLNGDRLDDDDAEIPFSITSKDIYASAEFQKVFYPKYVLLEIDAGNDIGVFISLDDKLEYQLRETAIKGVNMIKITPKSEDEKEARCRKANIILKEMSTRRVKVKRMALLYEEVGEEIIHMS